MSILDTMAHLWLGKRVNPYWSIRRHLIQFSHERNSSSSSYPISLKLHLKAKTTTNRSHSKATKGSFILLLKLQSFSKTVIRTFDAGTPSTQRAWHQMRIRDTIHDSRLTTLLKRIAKSQPTTDIVQVHCSPKRLINGYFTRSICVSHRTKRNRMNWKEGKREREIVRIIAVSRASKQRSNQ